MLVAEGIYCIRLPYQAAVYAAGHFKQTRNGAAAEAVINISLSVCLVPFAGLIGVAVGTFAAMTVRTVQYIWYYHAKLMHENALGKLGKLMGVSLLEIGMIVFASRLLPEAGLSDYLGWMIYSALVVTGCALIAGGFTLVFYRAEFRQMLAYAKKLIRKVN